MVDTDHGRPQEDNPEVSHEYRDINVRVIAGFGVVLVIAAVIVHLGLYWLLFYYERTAAEQAREVSPIEVTPTMPPEPRLQVSPAADLAAMRADEDEMLHTYGWIDKEKKLVRIPIDRAMEIVVEQGLPVRKKEKK